MEISKWRAKDVFYMVGIFVVINVIVTLIVQDITRVKK